MEIEMVKKMLTIILKSGTKIICRYDEENYEDIYNVWDDQRGRLCFQNCEILCSEIAVFQWEDA